MNNASRHYRGVAAHYDRLARHGAYGTLAPHNRGGRKSEYVATVFDEVLLPCIVDRGFKSLLDFGCGTGIFCRRSAAFVEKVTGVDVSPGVLDVAQLLCAGIANVKLRLIDGETLPFDDASFDCVVARETLCYVPDSNFISLLRELSRVLRPGGEFLLIDQVSNDPRWQHHPATPHQLKRAPAAIRAGAAEAGFVLQEERVVRMPRFPGVYLAWSGLVPRALLPVLARLEIDWHRRRAEPGHRWWDSFFRSVKPE